MGWTLVDDFGDDTIGEAKCFLLGTIRQKEDPGVFRADMVEGDGFVDFSCQAIADAAAMLDWASPKRVAQLEQQAADAENAAEDLREQLRILTGIEDLLGEALVRFPEAVAAKPQKGKAKK